MESKCFEVRDRWTFCPVICIKPIGVNYEQKYLLRRDGYDAGDFEPNVIYIKSQCRGVEYDVFAWQDRTHKTAHQFVKDNWKALRDGDVIDVEFILGETKVKKKSERHDD